MRKVIFEINDREYFKKTFIEEEGLTENAANDLISGMGDSFIAIFTLVGKDTTIDRYELTDKNGKKININSLNGYQKGVVLNDCYAYFEGRKYQNNGNKPCGVINIIETEI